MGKFNSMDLHQDIHGGTMKKTIVAIAVLTALCSTAASAAEHFGVTVYPGAVSDGAAKGYCAAFGPESIRQTREMFKDAKDGGTFCYHTGDDFDKVVDYYKKQKGVEPLGGPSIRGASKAMVFCKAGMQCASLGDGVDISVSTPWSVGKTVYKDVLITVRKASQ